MAEILVKFDQPIKLQNGEMYFAQALGKEVAGGLWEGWLEFLPRGEGATVQSGRETTQPNRTNLEYWAQGLTMVYLEGALARATALAARPAVASADGDADSMAGRPRRGFRPRSAPVMPRPVLDPFQVFAQGESVLRNELGALSRDHLDAIANAYDLTRAGSAGTGRVGNSVIIDAIVEGVRATQ